MEKALSDERNIRANGRILSVSSMLGECLQCQVCLENVFSVRRVWMIFSVRHASVWKMSSVLGMLVHGVRRMSMSGMFGGCL